MIMIMMMMIRPSNKIIQIKNNNFKHNKCKVKINLQTQVVVSLNNIKNLVKDKKI